MGVGGRARGFRSLSRADRWLVVESVLWLGVGRLAVVLLPFRRLAPHLGEALAYTPEHPAVPVSVERRATRVGWAVRTASRVTPWSTPCLVEAIAAQRMLVRRRLPTTLHLGLTKDGAVMTAHAWLMCGHLTLTGGGPVPQYTPLASFVTPADRRGQPV